MSSPDPTLPDQVPGAVGRPALEVVSRPLLRVVQHITGMETSFVTSINWDAQQQDVLFSLNTGALRIPEKQTTEWKASMCRSMFLAGRPASGDVGADVMATRNAVATGMKSFVAVPIMAGDKAIGTVCGASRRQIRLRDDQVDALQCIADALQQLLQVEQEKTLALERATRAEQEASQARDAASRHAIDLGHMAQLAHTDDLTGLPNRRAFFTRWEDALARSGRGHYGIGVLLVDGDRFKAVNDTFGHLVGNDVLRGVGESLRRAAGGDDFIARLGGDEFALGVCNASRDDLLAKAESVMTHFAAIAAGLGVETTLSIGIAHTDDGPRQQLLGNADQALYRSKAAGGNCATAFTGAVTRGEPCKVPGR